ncbi:MAG: hypothetical protein J0L63_12995 [Anaerolineae bacterium]|nr:hypothetical protein [Anaerolineae bacterium]MBN8619821.1 hypothetical protein [Anaerolineae bacterium]
MEPTLKMQAFKAQTQEKIQKLITEFATGAISREQFHIIYERYTSQLALADMAAASRSPDAVMGMLQDMPATIAVKEAHMGKAIGMMIYNNRSGTLLETLGEFDVPPEKLGPILNDFTLMMEQGKLVDREVRKISAKQWLVFAAGKFSTVVTLFRNEPSEAQCREIERLHRDFEDANRTYFQSSTVDANKLAYPFMVFVQRKVKG